MSATTLPIHLELSENTPIYLYLHSEVKKPLRIINKLKAEDAAKLRNTVIFHCSDPAHFSRKEGEEEVTSCKEEAAQFSQLADCQSHPDSCSPHATIYTLTPSIVKTSSQEEGLQERPHVGSPMYPDNHYFSSVSSPGKPSSPRCGVTRCPHADEDLPFMAKQPRPCSRVIQSEQTKVRSPIFVSSGEEELPCHHSSFRKHTRHHQELKQSCGESSRRHNASKLKSRTPPRIQVASAPEKSKDAQEHASYKLKRASKPARRAHSRIAQETFQDQETESCQEQQRMAHTISSGSLVKGSPPWRFSQDSPVPLKNRQSGLKSILVTKKEDRPSLPNSSSQSGLSLIQEDSRRSHDFADALTNVPFLLEGSNGRRSAELRRDHLYPGAPANFQCCQTQDKGYGSLEKPGQTREEGSEVSSVSTALQPNNTLLHSKIENQSRRLELIMMEEQAKLNQIVYQIKNQLSEIHALQKGLDESIVKQEELQKQIHKFCRKLKKTQLSTDKLNAMILRGDQLKRANEATKITYSMVKHSSGERVLQESTRLKMLDLQLMAKEKDVYATLNDKNKLEKEMEQQLKSFAAKLSGFARTNINFREYVRLLNMDGNTLIPVSLTPCNLVSTSSNMV